MLPYDYQNVHRNDADTGEQVAKDVGKMSAHSQFLNSKKLQTVDRGTTRTVQFGWTHANFLHKTKNTINILYCDFKKDQWYFSFITLPNVGRF